MRIIVMGAGGVGGYFGGRLAQAGQDVAFIARGCHLDAIRRNGLRLLSPVGDATIKVTASDETASLGNADIVLFAVKLWDTEAAAEQLRPVLGASTVVIPFQNGVDSIARTGAVLGASHVAGGVARIFAVIEEPGVIRHTGTLASLMFGATVASQRAMLAAFDEACASAGFEHRLVDDIELTLWQKFAFLAALSAATAVTRRPVGVIRADPDMRAMLEAALREAWEVGRARGIALAEDFVDKQLAYIDTLSPTMRASMANDLEMGNRLEVPWLSGHLVRMARDAGIAAPVHATLYAALKPYCAGTLEGKR